MSAYLNKVKRPKHDQLVVDFRDEMALMVFQNNEKTSTPSNLDFRKMCALINIIL